MAIYVQLAVRFLYTRVKSQSQSMCLDYGKEEEKFDAGDFSGGAQEEWSMPYFLKSRWRYCITFRRFHDNSEVSSFVLLGNDLPGMKMASVLTSEGFKLYKICIIVSSHSLYFFLLTSHTSSSTLPPPPGVCATLVQTEIFFSHSDLQCPKSTEFGVVL